jgi:lipid II:glycine glycyltransferase (peptidoglycan interpeptide bridge formation enzyme)
MWGVYRFKLGLGGVTIGTIGAWDFILKPLVFKLYSQAMPKILALLRNRRKATTSQDL